MIIVETLEGRTHFSVTVTEGYPGFYEVQGDDGDNVIAISVDQDNQTFTLDSVTYTGVVYIFVAGDDGNDQISVTAPTRGYVGTSVVAGDGHDTVTVNFDGAVWAGDGEDTVFLADSFRGEVYGQGDNDQIVVIGASADAEIDGGNGDDVLDATDNQFGCTLRGGNGDDVIYGSPHDDTIWGGNGMDVVAGFGGNDTFNMNDGNVDFIYGGDGDDWLYGDSNEGDVAEVENVG